MTQSPAMYRDVFLYGALAKGVGKRVRLFFTTPAEAVRLLDVNFPGFADRFKKGNYWVTKVNGNRTRDCTTAELAMGFTGEELHIMPEAVGAKKGKSLLTMLVGGLIIGAAFFLSGGTAAGLAAPLAQSGLLAGATWGTVAQLGIGLVVSGVGSLLTPTQNTNYDDANERQSYVFNGPIAVTQAGGPVPLVFGEMMVGTTVLSASLDVERLDSDGEVIKGAPYSPEIVFDTQAVPSGGHVIELDELVTSAPGARIVDIGGTTIADNATGTVAVGDFDFDYDTGATEVITVTWARGDEAVGQSIRVEVVTEDTDTNQYTSVITIVAGPYSDSPATSISYATTNDGAGAFTNNYVEDTPDGSGLG